jgi:hypothetical protein
MPYSQHPERTQAVTRWEQENFILSIVRKPGTT